MKRISSELEMQKPELLIIGFIRDHAKHSWICILDWELFLCSLCNKQVIRTLSVQFSPNRGSLNRETHLTSSFCAFQTFIYISLSSLSFFSFFFSVDIYSIYKPTPLLLFSFPVTSEDTSMQTVWLELYLMEFMQISHAMTVNLPGCEVIWGIIQLAALNIVSRDTVAHYVYTILKQSSMSSCESQ